MTIYDIYKQNKIQINVVRLLLAVLVVFSHTFPLGGFGSDPLIIGALGVSGTVSFGTFAVAGFFSLSGFLVTRSAIVNDPGEFILARFLRVWPGYFVSLLVSGFMVLPAILIIQGTLTPEYFQPQSSSVYSYVMRNALLPLNLQWDILGGPVEVPYPGSINGSLWTLPLEVRAYAVALLLVLLGSKLGTKRVFVTSVAALGFLIVFKNLNQDLVATLFPEFINLELLFVFLAGGLFAVLGEGLKVDRKAVFIAFGFLVLGISIHNASLAVIFLSPMALLLPWFAGLWKKSVPKFFLNDYSFGTYIFAFPIQQLVAASHLFSNPVAFFLFSLAATLLLAALSWHLIEKPSLNLRKRLSGHRSGTKTK